MFFDSSSAKQTSSNAKLVPSSDDRQAGTPFAQGHPHPPPARYCLALSKKQIATLIPVLRRLIHLAIRENGLSRQCERSMQGLLHRCLRRTTLGTRLLRDQQGWAKRIKVESHIPKQPFEKRHSFRRNSCFRRHSPESERRVHENGAMDH